MTTITNSVFFDGENEKLISGLNIFISDGRISEISDRPPTPDDGKVIDASGKYAMPGLIDAHIHAYALTVNVSEVTKAPLSLMSAWASTMLSKMLKRGFTTVRDAGGADYGLKLALDRGYYKGPRLYYCGRCISPTGGHSDLRDPHGECFHEDQAVMCGCGLWTNVAVVVDGKDAIRTAVRENIRRGASFIKFMASGGVGSTGDNLFGLQYSDEEISAIVDEVDRQGLYCAAHAHPDNAIKRALKLGVTSIEHATLIEPDTARLAADKDAFLVPTLATIYASHKRGAELGMQPASIEKLSMITDEAIERLQHMKDAGVKIGFGTDLVGELEDEQCREFTLRANIFSPYEILKQATSLNAELIGATGELGVIKEGAHADILILNGNPLEDISLFDADGSNIDRIIQGGSSI